METRRANKSDVLNMWKIMSSCNVDSEIFIRSTKKQIKELVKKGSSFVVCDENKLLGFVLGFFPLASDKLFYVDTIMSVKSGCGKLLLEAVEESLEDGSVVMAHTSPKNKKSIKMFMFKGFVKVLDDVLMGKDRILFCKRVYKE